MEIEFKKNGKVAINMKDYILEAFGTFGENVFTDVAYFATSKLF